MRKKRIFGLAFLVFIGLLLLYPTLRQTLPFLFYSIQSLTTENEHRTVAKCEDVTWSTATNDSASWGMLGIIDSRPVPARLRHYVTLTGSIKNQPYISITAREYEPYPHFGVEKHSAEIELQVSNPVRKTQPILLLLIEIFTVKCTPLAAESAGG